MSMQAPEVRSTPTQPPLDVGSGREPTGFRPRSRWLVVVVALVLGALVGYLLRWGTEPTKTLTKAVATTATKTVAPPAFAGDHVAVRVNFDGTRCLYQGPGELKAGSTVEVKYTSTVPDSSWFMWWLEPGTTYKELMGLRAESYDRYSPTVASVPHVTGYNTFPIGGSNAYTRISVGDLISIGCDAPGTPVVIATMMRVVRG